MTISCFRTFLIFIQSYIFNFCIYFKCFFLYLFMSIFSFADINKKGIVQRKKLATTFKSKSIINNELKALKCYPSALSIAFLQMSTRSRMEARPHKRKRLRGSAIHSTISMGQVGLAFSRRQQCLFKINLKTLKYGLLKG